MTFLTTLRPQLSSANSTSTPLLASAVFTGTAEDVLSFNVIEIFINTDVDSANLGLQVQFSTDQTTWKDTHVLTITNEPTNIPVKVIARYFRIVYTNGGVGQTTFQLSTILNPYTGSTQPQTDQKATGTDTGNLMLGITDGAPQIFKPVSLDTETGSIKIVQTDIFGDAVYGTQTNTDAAGRIEVAETLTTGDYRFAAPLLSVELDTYTTVDGSVVKSSTTSSAVLSVGTGAGSVAFIQTRQTHPYFAGKAQQFEFTMFNFGPQTGIVKRAGYFYESDDFTTTPTNPPNPATDGIDGIYMESGGGSVKLRISREGTDVLNIAQGSWNKDNLDGTGPSGITIDWDNFNVYLVDFLWLGGAICNFYIFIGGRRVLVHTFPYANIEANTITRLPQMPLTYSIYNTGTDAGSFNVVCMQVGSMGPVSQLVGIPLSLAMVNPTTSLGTTSYYPLIGIRLCNTSPRNRNANVLLTSLTVSSNDNSKYFAWYLYYAVGGLTVVGTQPTWTQLAGCINYSILNENGNGSTVNWAGISSTHITESGTATGRITQGIHPNQLRRLGAPIDMSQNWDEMWIIVHPFSASTTVGSSLSIGTIY